MNNICTHCGAPIDLEPIDPLDDDRDDQPFEPDDLTMERWATAYLDTEGASDPYDR